MLYMVLLCIADLAILSMALYGQLVPGVALLAHLALSGAAVLSWWTSGRARRLAPVLGMALGPVVMLGAILAPPLDSILRRRAATGDPVTIDGVRLHRARAASGGRAMVARFLDGRISHPAADSLGSLITIFRHGDVNDRRSALETAVRSFDPRLSPVIARALTDDDQTIRALAAAATSQIAQKLAEERQRFAAAVVHGDAHDIARLGPVLMDHSRFDVLLSDTQRDQIATDVTATAVSDGGEAASDGEREWLEAVRTSWAARDWSALDRLCDQADGHGSAAQWWAGHSPC